MFSHRLHYYKCTKTKQQVPTLTLGSRGLRMEFKSVHFLSQVALIPISKRFKLYVKHFISSYHLYILSTPSSFCPRHFFPSIHPLHYLTNLTTVIDMFLECQFKDQRANILEIQSNVNITRHVFTLFWL